MQLLSDKRFLTFGVLNNLCGGTLHNSYSRIGGSCDIDVSMRSKFSSSAKGQDLPKSIPMTGPLTFFSASSEYFLTNDEPSGVRRRFAERVAEDVARGSCSESQSMLMHALCKSRGRGNIQLLTVLKTT
jgi:hypothetical protein